MARLSETAGVPATRRGTLAGAALQAGARWRRTTRWTGLAIFILGAGLLAYVFMQALQGLQQFAQPDYLATQLNRMVGGAKQGDIAAQVQAAVAVFGAELLRVLYLLLLGFLASAIATRGIQFFAASDSVIDEAVVAGLEENEP